MADTTVTIAADRLEAYARDILAVAGVPAAHAALWAEVLVWSNLRGTDSHGVARIPGYLAWIANGTIVADAEPRLLRSTVATAVFDGAFAPGPVGMLRASDEAMALAREAGIGWVQARDLAHVGPLGWYARRIAGHGLVAILLLASRGPMAWPDARGVGSATSPLAIAIPAGKAGIYAVDMSTTTVAMGQILAARDAGRAIPEGWAADAEGRPTTEAARATMLMPLGGYKGAALSFMIECLAGGLVANSMMLNALSGRSSRVSHQNCVLAVLDPSAMGDPATSAAEIAALGEAIRALPALPGTAGPVLPGERGDRIFAARRRDGIPLAAETWQHLGEAATALGVAVPSLV
ncbi:MAG: Ldh family oxidoreductase [Alphaproteobacteria bacterium]|nr:Ldh family oxidoreductase [Alphaproteobacteria bacterium]